MLHSFIRYNRLMPVVLTVCILSAFYAHSGLAAEKKSLVIYSARKAHLIDPLLNAYSREKNIEIITHTAKAPELKTRLQAEGDKTPADILLTVDAGNLWDAAQSGLLVPVKSATLQQNIPQHLRAPNDQWVGLSIRARTIVYHKDRVKPSELVSYEDLASDKWKGRLCLRTSAKVYNQSLVATMIAHLGRDKAKEVVKGWVANLNTKAGDKGIFSSDTKLMEAMLAGEQCDVGIVNTYYYGRLQSADAKIKLALFWPNQQDRGVHVNVSGAGLVKYSKEAVDLIEWLSSKKAQQQFAGLNYEFPVNEQVAVDELVKSWGSFKSDNINIAKAGELQKDAIMLMDEVGYN